MGEPGALDGTVALRDDEGGRRMACPIWGVFLFARDVVLFTHQSDNTRQQHPGDMPIVPSDSDGDQNRYVISAPNLLQQVSTDAGSEIGSDERQ